MNHRGGNILGPKQLFEGQLGWSSLSRPVAHLLSGVRAWVRATFLNSFSQLGAVLRCNFGLTPKLIGAAPRSAQLFKKVALTPPTSLPIQYHHARYGLEAAQCFSWFFVGLA